MKKKSDKTHKNNTGSKDNVNRRERIEEKLRHEERLFRALAEHSSDIIVILNLEGIITYINPAVERVLGFKAEERIGARGLELVHPDDMKFLADSSNILARDTSAPVIHGEMHLRHKDGSWRTLEAVGSNLVNNNVVEAIIVNYRDITERKQAEAALRQEQQFSKLVLDNLPGIFYLYTYPENRLMLWNKQVETLLGFNAEELRGRLATEWFTPENREAALKAIEEVFEKGQSSRELPLLMKDGLQRPFFLTGVKFEAHDQFYFMGIGTDITERKQMEYELRASESNFRYSLDDSPLGVRISTIEGETIYANRAILDIYGYDSIEELRKTSIKERYTPESYANFQLRKEKRLRGEFGPSEYEISIVRKNGEIRHLHVFRKEIFWNGKKQSQVVYQDITERRQAEEKLRETLESLRKSIKTTIQVLGTASETRDPYTAGHQKRVADLARSIATDMGLSQDKIEGIRMAGSIHDIGKLSIPSEILSKPTKLTEIEFSIIKAHAQKGYKMLKDMESPWPLAQIVYQHHERMNGSGYPRNLKGDEILIEARIMAVADVVEAMASYRPYRLALGIEAALEEIKKNKGILYDDTVVDTCLRLFREKGYQLT
jgi:PAS domain S-box-containing protein/putative nucleotidyltransferase with HDIG domain